MTSIIFGAILFFSIVITGIYLGLRDAHNDVKALKNYAERLKQKELAKKGKRDKEYIFVEDEIESLRNQSLEDEEEQEEEELTEDTYILTGDLI